MFAYVAKFCTLLKLVEAILEDKFYVKIKILMNFKLFGMENADM